MSVVRGFEVLTGTYLGQDWDLFGATVDQSIANFAQGHTSDLPDAIAGLEALLGSAMTDEELDRRWIYELHAGYDPRDDGFTYREWFAHALEVLRAEAARQGR